MPSVLIVDDSPVVRHTIQRRLAQEGLDVVVEATAGAARDADLAKVDCAIVDIELPDGSGCDLAAEMLGRKPGLRVAFFTAGASGDVLDRAREHGPVFWKPEIEDLIAWVKKATQPPPTK